MLLTLSSFCCSAFLKAAMSHSLFVLWSVLGLTSTAPIEAFVAGPANASSADNFLYTLAAGTRVEVTEGPTTVSSLTGVHAPERGYFPLPVFIDNRKGPNQLIDIVYHSINDQGGSATIHKSVSVVAGESRALSLAIPVASSNGSLRVTGATVGKTIANSLYATSSGGSLQQWLCLGSAGALEAAIGPPSEESTQTEIGCLPANAAPTELAGYAGYHGVFLPDADSVTQLNDSQLTALTAYVSTGGVVTLPTTKTSERKQALQRAALSQFGKVYEHRSGERFDFQAVRGTTAKSNPLDQARNGYRFGPPRLLVEGEVPVVAFFVLIFGFFLLIGPGSWFIAQKVNPAMLLVTIPATSLLTCLALGAYSLLVDGLRIHVASVAVTFLDNEAHQASTVGVSAYYANLPPASLGFANMTAVLPVENGYPAPPPLSIDWDKGMWCNGTVLPSRTYTELAVHAVQPSRARLQLEKQNDQYLVRNALGSSIERVRVNVEGQLYQADSIADGAQALLRLAPQIKAPREFPELNGRVELPPALTDSPAVGHFEAWLTSPTFVPLGDVPLEISKSANLVIGAYVTP